MGSLISSPKISTGTSTVRTVRVPVSSSDNSSGSQTTAATSTDESVASPAEAREQNLLRRNRGRFGTVQTGFRGLELAGNTARKSLLGE